ncbi:Cwf18 protein [Raphanus sativus]|uniref:Uncharacterized protein LOC108863376 n=1 Tax=Raphanus sativus TaxID=3726 RepID=A0A6J0P9C3_RAPSA|nr:uncharacterized protein LOC108863376 [Raphanus sativus]XP_018493281.1 uncharacterized protein LOC108863376 [Raphanus sativus]XP_018493282.1 uncharacterized protein LOC108863376 [Raphanus sativus]KAJ4898503.1 Cwf18 protein [Raphanus sativus]
MGSERDSVEDKAAARKEALRALRAAQELSESKEEEEDVAGDEDGPAMKFRNYVPQDKELQDGKVAPPELPKFEDPITALPPSVEKKEDAFVNIAPKKPNWDLRRDVQKKLDELERRTQRAYKLMEEHRKEREADEDVIES